MMNKEVEEGLAANKPIVALESTIISHGMPYPRNLEVAIELENIIRKKGAIPATIAIIGGFPKVGLLPSELEFLAKPATENNKIIKASRRDIAYACANRLHAATTVSATMILAEKCGIRVFATGGIGGVHRGAEITMDISADLKELSQTPVTVVCSGVKSILDIPKTLEVLEYQGVPVYGYQTNIFPAFFTNDSGCKSPFLASTPLEIARAMICQYDLEGLNGQGMLIGVPNPNPGNTVHIETAIQQALQEANLNGIHGNAVTPFLLSRVKELTGGLSLEANIALVKNNASVAADIAIEYAPLAQAAREERRRNHKKSSQSTNFDARPSSDTSSSLSSTTSSTTTATTSPPELSNEISSLSSPSVVVFGGAVVDQMMTPLSSQSLILHTSNPGNISYSYGGVGRNIAEGLTHLGSATPYLVTVVGNDANGINLINDCKSKGMNTTFITQSTSSLHSTAVYSAVHDHTGDLVVAIAAMDIFQKLLTADIIQKQIHLQNLLKSSCEIVVIDGNISIDLFSSISAFCLQYDIPIFFEPTSVPKCVLPISASCLHHVDVMKPNTDELCAMMTKCLINEKLSITNRSHVSKILQKYSETTPMNSKKSVAELVADMRILGSGLLSIMNSKSNRPSQEFRKKNRCVIGKHLLISLGKHGILWIGPSSVIGRDADISITDHISSKHIWNAPIENVINTSGAGDSFCAGLISNLLSSDGNGIGPNLGAILNGMKYAEKSLTSVSAIPK